MRKSKTPPRYEIHIGNYPVGFVTKESARRNAILYSSKIRDLKTGKLYDNHWNEVEEKPKNKKPKWFYVVLEDGKTWVDGERKKTPPVWRSDLPQVWRGTVRVEAGKVTERIADKSRDSAGAEQWHTVVRWDGYTRIDGVEYDEVPAWVQTLPEEWEGLIRIYEGKRVEEIEKEDPEAFP